MRWPESPKLAPMPVCPCARWPAHTTCSTLLSSSQAAFLRVPTPGPLLGLDSTQAPDLGGACRAEKGAELSQHPVGQALR